MVRPDECGADENEVDIFLAEDSEEEGDDWDWRRRRKRDAAGRASLGLMMGI